MAGFKVQCTTTTASESVSLPLVNGEAYSMIVAWGDGTPDSVVTAWDDADATHTYTTAGTYQIELIGLCGGWSVANTHSSRLKWTAIIDYGDVEDFYGFDYVYGFFWGCTNLTSLGSGSLILTQYATNAQRLFLSCTNMTGVIGSEYFAYGAQIVDLSYAFYGTKVSEFENQSLRNLTNCVSFYRSARAANYAKLNPWMFFDEGEESSRFLNKSVNFEGAFRPTTALMNEGTAPRLWECNYGTGTPTPTDCFLTHNAATLTNYYDIPLAWGGPSTQEVVESVYCSPATFFGGSVDIYCRALQNFWDSPAASVRGSATQRNGIIVADYINHAPFWGVFLNSNSRPSGMVSFFPVTLASYRRPAGSYVSGLWVASTVRERPVWIVELQPDTGDIGQYPEEGNRVYSHFKSWASARILVNDILTHNGTDYLVVRVGPWHEQAGFCKIFIRGVQS